MWCVQVCVYSVLCVCVQVCMCSVCVIVNQPCEHTSETVDCPVQYVIRNHMTLCIPNTVHT